MNAGIEITQVAVRLQDAGSVDPVESYVLAFASVTFNGLFKVHEFRVVRNRYDKVIVLFPSRRVMDKCPSCNSRNHLRAKHCNNCGIRLADDRGHIGNRREVYFYNDVAHPIDDDFRNMVVGRVMAQYESAVADRAREQGADATSTAAPNAIAKPT